MLPTQLDICLVNSIVSFTQKSSIIHKCESNKDRFTITIIKITKKKRLFLDLVTYFVHKPPRKPTNNN